MTGYDMKFNCNRKLNNVIASILLALVEKFLLFVGFYLIFTLVLVVGSLSPKFNLLQKSEKL
jgi:hypothetical protein